MTDSYQVLNEIRKYYRIIGSPVSLWLIHERIGKKFKLKPKQIGRFLKQLHQMGRIEVTEFNKIKPLGELKNGTVNERDIKDVLLDLRKAKPVDAYRHFLDTHNVFVNPESFTRLMRRMAEDGIIQRNGEYYFVRKDFTQRRLL